MHGPDVVEVVPDGLGQAERFRPRHGSRPGNLRETSLRQPPCPAEPAAPAEQPGHPGGVHVQLLLSAKQNVNPCRAVRDPGSHAGSRIRTGPFPGWAQLATWNL
jgi:hypothetical protein